MSGSRQKIPPTALKECPTCHEKRGNTRRGWHPIERAGEVVGYTCPACPTWNEPIRLEPSGRFLAVVGYKENGKRKQAKRRFDDLETAREWVDEVRTGAATAARRGLPYRDGSTLTVRQIAKKWLDRRRSEIGQPGGIRATTLAGYESSLASLLDIIGDRPAREIIADDIEAALRKLQSDGGRWGQPMAHRSLSYALGTLRQVFAYGVRNGWLLENVADEAKAPRKPSKGTDGGSRRAQRWSVEELVQFRDHADTYGEGELFASLPWVAVGMRLTLCGLRRSEVLGLDWENVDISTGEIHVVASRTKAGNSTELNGTKTDRGDRVVAANAIHAGTANMLRALWLAQGRPERGLLIRDSAGEPVAPDSFSYRFRQLCRGAGVRYPGSIHNCRHTLATSLQEAGVPDVQAAALLGHDVATYRSFYLVTDEDGANAAATVAGRLFAM